MILCDLYVCACRHVEQLGSKTQGSKSSKTLFVFKRLGGKAVPILGLLGWEWAPDKVTAGANCPPRVLDGVQAINATMLIADRLQGGAAVGRKDLIRFYEEGHQAPALLRSSQSVPQQVRNSSDSDLRSFAAQRLSETTELRGVDFRALAVICQRDVMLLSEGDRLSLTLFLSKTTPTAPSELPLPLRGLRWSTDPDLFSDGLRVWIDDASSLDPSWPGPGTLVLCMDESQMFRICMPRRPWYSPPNQVAGRS
jgi:hypothetical protein